MLRWSGRFVRALQTPLCLDEDQGGAPDLQGEVLLLSLSYWRHVPHR